MSSRQTKTTAKGGAKTKLKVSNGLAHYKNSKAQETVDEFVQEARSLDEHRQALRLWQNFSDCTARIEAEVRLRLRDQFRVTLPRFELLAQLQQSPEGVRMGELSQRLRVTGGNVTSMTDQLEEEKLVRRIADPRDRRAYSVKLTAPGKRLFIRMARAHEEWIAELLGGWSVQDRKKMQQLLDRLKPQLKAPPSDLPTE